MKREWTVRIEISQPRVVFTDDHADHVIDALRLYSPSVSYGRHTMSARFYVAAESPTKAADSGLGLLLSALRKVGPRTPLTSVVGVEVQAIHDLDRALDEPNLPDLVGVDEVAKMLEVSKQRASELARRANFPKPIARLASGPVWKKASIARHARTWDRRPGRKKALVASK